MSTRQTANPPLEDNLNGQHTAFFKQALGLRYVDTKDTLGGVGKACLASAQQSAMGQEEHITDLAGMYILTQVVSGCNVAMWCSDTLQSSN